MIVLCTCGLGGHASDVLACRACTPSDRGWLHERLLSKRLFEEGHMFLTVLPWVKVGAATQAVVPLFEEPEDGVEEHLILRLTCRVQELPGRDVVMATNASDESERAQNLLLGEQNLHNLIVGRRQTLQHVQGELVCRGVGALQRQQQTGQGFGVAEDVVLQQLVQHVEQVVLDQCLDHQLIQVVLHSDVELVEGADVLHQHGDDELMTRSLSLSEGGEDVCVHV